MSSKQESLLQGVRDCITRHSLADEHTPVLLMVSGGSDSTALVYLAAALHQEGVLGPLGIMHLNHLLRGEDAADDALFVEDLAELFGIPAFISSLDIAGITKQEGGNIEAVARRERYRVAQKALVRLCQRAAMPVAQGRIFTAHTADDRVENFYMRSIVGTGPGGFRSMRYLNGQVARPLLFVSRQELRDYLVSREVNKQDCVHDKTGSLWREDATNAHTDRFRAYVRHEIVPRAKQRNPHLLKTLSRTMDLIADEDDFLSNLATELLEEQVKWLGDAPEEGCLISPEFGRAALPLARRAVFALLQRILGPQLRIETTSLEAVLEAWEEAGEETGGFAGSIRGGYVANIQGNLAVSANKQGVRIEPMTAFRARRKRC